MALPACEHTSGVADRAVFHKMIDEERVDEFFFGIAATKSSSFIFQTVNNLGRNPCLAASGSAHSIV